MLLNLVITKNKMNHPSNIYATDTRLAHFEAQLAKTTDPNTQVNLLFQKANALLEYGDEVQAVKLFEQLAEYVKDVPQSSKHVNLMLGVAYMRLAERNNCINQHGADACILPIMGNGIHQDKAPARKAVNSFLKTLTGDPTNYNAIWLLNLAYMTLGEYPGKVPNKWLIKNLDHPGELKIKPFTDMATDLKIDIKNRAGGAIVEDFDNDGYLDIITSAWGLDDPMHYYRNNADGTFSDRSKISNLGGLTGGLNMVQADYDNDGFIDIFVLRGGWQGVSGFGEQPNSLLHNNGDGTFTDVTIEAGMLSFRPTQTATWNDFNRDGWVDLFVANESSDPKVAYPCEFYLNNGDGTFKDVAADIKMNLALFVKGVVSGDYDNDGWPDIFLSCMSGQKVLLRNQGTKGNLPSFENVSEKAGFSTDKSRSFPTFFFDYDNDGWLDLFICNYEFEQQLSFYAGKEGMKPTSDRSGKMSLYHNNGDGTFTNMAPKMQVNQPIFAMGANFGDIDNDGYLDMYLATGNPSYQSLVPNKLYKNINGKDFVDVTVSGRVGNLQKGHGVSFADINNNGDQDIYVDMGGAYRGDGYNAAFYLNPGQTKNNWICVKLEGTRSNRAAIGAKVIVKFQENGVQRTVYREVNSGGSFGCSPFRREIGIGTASTIDELTIIWPTTGKHQTLQNLKPNQFIKIVEGKNGYEQLPINTLVFKKLDGTLPMCAPVNL